MSAPADYGCCAACWLPLEMCECGHYTNGDADEDAEAGIRGDDAGFYTDDGA